MASVIDTDTNVTLAQAQSSGEQPIGAVETLTGTVVAIRADGTRVELEPGSPVYQGDTLETGEDGALGIILADETTFSMAENFPPCSSMNEPVPALHASFIAASTTRPLARRAYFAS